MWKKILEKLANKLIQEAYEKGKIDGYSAAREPLTKTQFKKGHTPWNKGKKKGVEK